MNYINLKNTIDPFFQKIEEYKDTTPIRIFNAATPLLLMGKTTGKPLSFSLSAYQVIRNSYYTLKSGDEKYALKLAHTIVQMGLNSFYPKYLPLYFALTQVISNPKDLKGWIAQSLNLAAFYTHRLEIFAASLLFQGACTLKEGYQEYRNEKYIEAVGKLTLGGFQGYTGIHFLQGTFEINGCERIWQKIEPLETKLTREEFEILREYVEKHPKVKTLTHIRRSDHHLPYSLTLTPEGTYYIHLHQHLGHGLFKAAFKILKIDQEAKLMAEVKVYCGLDDALKENRLAETIGSPYINGPAECIIRYGNNLSFIQKLMDMDGRQYFQTQKGSANERLKLMSDVAKGLGALHQKGWLHQDLHPGNILFKLGKNPQGQLSDLGFVRPSHPLEFTFQNEIRDLGNLIGNICGPLWKEFPENPKLQQLQQTIQAIPKNQLKSLISAYDIADQLDNIQVSLGEKGDIPLEPYTLNI